MSPGVVLILLGVWQSPLGFPLLAQDRHEGILQGAESGLLRLLGTNEAPDRGGEPRSACLLMIGWESPARDPPWSRLGG